MHSALHGIFVGEERMTDAKQWVQALLVTSQKQIEGGLHVLLDFHEQAHEHKLNREFEREGEVEHVTGGTTVSEQLQGQLPQREVAQSIKK